MSSGPDGSRRCVRWTWRALLRWTLRLLVPTAIFGWYQNFTYLDPLAAPRMLVGADWTTYIVSPNFLRGAPWFTVPIAQIPHYVAPLGSNLGQTDSVPILGPVYRLLLTVFGDRPIQLVGWILLGGTVLTFNCFARFLDHVRSDLRSWEREAVTLMLAAVVVVVPFRNLQIVHPALMQAWIIVWALSGALRRCPSVLGGGLEPAAERWTGLGPVCVAAAVQPYFLPMVLLPVFAPDIARLRVHWRWVLVKFSLAMGVACAIGYLCGFLGSSGELGGGGFGSYAADLSTLVDPDFSSRYLPDIATSPGAIGGYGYVGLGALALLVAGAVCAWAVRTRTAPNGAPGLRADRWPAAFLYVSAALVSLFAVLPQLRLGGHVLVDLSAVTNVVSDATALFRTNGRFVWVPIWLMLMLATGSLLRVRAHRAILATAVVSVMLQGADVVPYPDLLRPPASVEYEQALAVLRGSGVTWLEFQQPAVLVPGCYDGSVLFTEYGDVLLAASVLELPVSTGYTARVNPEAAEEICVRRAEQFQRSDFRKETGYVVARDRVLPEGLTCTALTEILDLCQAIEATAPPAP